MSNKRAIIVHKIMIGFISNTVYSLRAKEESGRERFRIWERT